MPIGLPSRSATWSEPITQAPGCCAATAWAGEAKAPQRPAAAMFERLDKNHDKQITPDEVPPGAPERLKAALIKADTSGDKKVSVEEFAAAASALRTAVAAPADSKAAVKKTAKKAAAKKTEAKKALKAKKPVAKKPVAKAPVKMKVAAASMKPAKKVARKKK